MEAVWWPWDLRVRGCICVMLVCVNRSALKSACALVISIFHVCVVASLRSDSASGGEAVVLPMPRVLASIFSSVKGSRSFFNAGFMGVCKKSWSRLCARLGGGAEARFLM